MIVDALAPAPARAPRQRAGRLAKALCPDKNFVGIQNVCHSLLDPYHQNSLKGDRPIQLDKKPFFLPITGDDWYFAASAISDSIVDLFLSKDSEARIACETLTTTNKVVLAGEIRCKGVFENDQWAEGALEEIEQTVRDTVKRIGYEQSGFHWQTFDFSNNLHAQSAHIAMGVDESGNKDEGAGDQGIMFGYATDETPGLMPATLYYSHKILEKMAADRHSGAAPFLEPDAKSQVTLQYENGVPVRATAIVVSTQHSAELSNEAGQAKLRDYVKSVLTDILPEGWLPEEKQIYVNPTGLFEIGGPDGDAGLTGRKIIVDTYGGAAPHGGGAFSGKDPTKVDRSAAYAARQAALHLVRNKMARRAEEAESPDSCSLVSSSIDRSSRPCCRS